MVCRHHLEERTGACSVLGPRSEAIGRKGPIPQRSTGRDGGRVAKEKLVGGEWVYGEDEASRVKGGALAFDHGSCSGEQEKFGRVAGMLVVGQHVSLHKWKNIMVIIA